MRARPVARPHPARDDRWSTASEGRRRSERHPRGRRRLARPRSETARGCRPDRRSGHSGNARTSSRKSSSQGAVSGSSTWPASITALCASRRTILSPSGRIAMGRSLPSLPEILDQRRSRAGVLDQDRPGVVTLRRAPECGGGDRGTRAARGARRAGSSPSPASARSCRPRSRSSGSPSRPYPSSARSDPPGVARAVGRSSETSPS